MVPQLQFEIEGAESLSYCATPTVKFALRIGAPGGVPVRAILLDVQIQIAARQRAYGSEAVDGLLELFGTPERWRTTLRTLPWIRSTLVVPPFTGSTLTDLLVPCSYDLEVTAARYFAALDGGQVPLEFLFSGSVFFSGPHGGLQTARIAMDREAEYRLPVAIWRQAIDRHFPDSAWVRLHTDSFQRLLAYKARNAFETWDAALDALLTGVEVGAP